MKPLILISHGQLATQLKATTEMIMGPQADIHTVCLLPNDGPETFRQALVDTLAQSGAQTVFTDLNGGTPANTAVKLLLNGADFDLYAGMNLPMVISYLNGELIGTQADVVADAKAGIVHLNDLLNVNDDDDE